MEFNSDASPLSPSTRRRSASVGLDNEAIKEKVYYPSNHLICAMLTDKYQISMAYAYWKQGIYNKHATFDLFFRKCPFDGEFCIFAGLEEVISLLSTFHFTIENINSLKKMMPECDIGFWDFLIKLDASEVVLYCQKEGSVVFPREPLLKIEGPLAICQLLETALLNLINFPSLVATCAARMRLAVNTEMKLFEFGLRRAQGPDGGLSASKYSYLGGFDGTSNVLAASQTDIPCIGTHAHAFVMSYSSLDDLQNRYEPIDKNNINKSPNDFVDLCLSKLDALGYPNTNKGELAAFIAYAQSFPNGFLALIDTYDTLSSGAPNACAVSSALIDRGYEPKGIRLDSGDLAYLSKMVRAIFIQADKIYGYNDNDIKLTKMSIIASNDLNENVLLGLQRQGHDIDAFGIGTHLVTCQAQPALGCVFKLVEIDGIPRIKLSQEVGKLVIPCSKSVYRLKGKTGEPIVDVIQRSNEAPPKKMERILVRHPFEEQKRAHVIPTDVEPLLNLVWEKGAVGENVIQPLNEARKYCMSQLKAMRKDHIRPMNPTPYKISVSSSLYDFMHALWMDEAPISELV